MASNIVRINPGSKEILLGFAQSYRLSLPKMLDRVVEHYRRQHLFDQANAVYEKLRQDPKTWQSYKKELQLWEGTLLDGLDPGAGSISERRSKYTAKRKHKKRKKP